VLDLYVKVRKHVHLVLGCIFYHKISFAIFAPPAPWYCTRYAPHDSRTVPHPWCKQTPSLYPTTVWYFVKHGLTHKKKWQTLRSYFDLWNISREKDVRSYWKPLQNFLPVRPAVIVMLLSDQRLCNCKASMPCKLSRENADIKFLLLQHQQLHKGSVWSLLRYKLSSHAERIRAKCQDVYLTTKQSLFGIFTVSHQKVT